MPAVAGERVHVGSCAGKFLAISWRSGETIWGYDVTADGAQTGFHGDPAMHGDRVLAAVDNLLGQEGDGSVYAFDTEGAVLWHVLEQSGVPTDVVIEEERVFVTNMDDEIVCIDLETGEILWRRASGATNEENGPVSPPLIVDGIVYQFGLNGVIAALDPEDGMVWFEIKTDFRFTSEPVIMADDIVIGTEEQDLLVLPIGEEVDPFVIGLGHRVMETPLVLDDGSMILLSFHDQVVKLGADLTIQWEAVLDANWLVEQPVAWSDGEQVVIGREDGVLEGLDIATGESLWTHQLEGQIRVVAPIERDLLVGTLEGAVMRLDGDRVGGSGEE